MLDSWFRDQVAHSFIHPSLHPGPLSLVKDECQVFSNQSTLYLLARASR